MDKKLFDKLLREYAEVEEQEYQETVYESELDESTGLEHIVQRTVTVRNPPTLKKLKPHLHHCDFCNKTVTDQMVHIRVAQDPVPHWRTRCHTCKSYIHPETRSPMDENALSTSLAKISRYHKNKKLGLKQFKPEFPKVVKYDSESKITEHDDNITITEYFHKRNK